MQHASCTMHAGEFARVRFTGKTVVADVKVAQCGVEVRPVGHRREGKVFERAGQCIPAHVQDHKLRQQRQAGRQLT